MSKSGKSSNLSGIFAFLVIVLAFAAAFIIYKFVLGNPNNFEGGDPEKGHPLAEGAAHLFGLIYKGGIIVPILITQLIVVITFAIERTIVIIKARGKGGISDFVRQIRSMLEANQLDEAITLCDRQRGSVANVVRSTLVKYKELQGESNMDKDQKVVALQKEVEEATTLELPTLERNLVILATITSVATLTALLGTVIGMIKAFSALAQAGAPDAIALSNGISEALINTAFGIGISALAIILYNIFTTNIDKITYAIDEAGFSIANTFSTKNK